MKIYLYILIILTASFVFQSNDSFACGDTSTEITEGKKSCCSEQSNDEKNDCENCSDDDCGGGCGSSSCKCTHSVSVPLFKTIEFKVNHNFNTSKKCWNFNQNPPKPVYLSIWKPPNIA